MRIAQSVEEVLTHGTIFPSPISVTGAFPVDTRIVLHDYGVLMDLPASICYSGLMVYIANARADVENDPYVGKYFVYTGTATIPMWAEWFGKDSYAEFLALKNSMSAIAGGIAEKLQLVTIGTPDPNGYNSNGACFYIKDSANGGTLKKWLPVSVYEDLYGNASSLGALKTIARMLASRSVAAVADLDVLKTAGYPYPGMLTYVVAAGKYYVWTGSGVTATYTAWFTPGEVSAINTRFVGLEQTVSAHSQAFTAHDATTVSQNQMLQSHAASINGISSAVGTLSTTSSTHTQQINANASAISAVTTTVTTHTQQIVAATAENVSQTNMLASHAGTLNGIALTLSTLNQTTATHTTQINTNIANINAHTQAITSLAELANELHQTSILHGNSITAIESQANNPADARYSLNTLTTRVKAMTTATAPVPGVHTLELPGGMMIKFGFGPAFMSPSNWQTEQTTWFVAPFPNACLMVCGSVKDTQVTSTPNNCAATYVKSWDKNSFVTRHVSPNNGTNNTYLQILYMAIGY